MSSFTKLALTQHLGLWTVLFPEVPSLAVSAAAPQVSEASAQRSAALWYGRGEIRCPWRLAVLPSVSVGFGSSVVVSEVHVQRLMNISPLASCLEEIRFDPGWYTA